MRILEWVQPFCTSFKYWDFFLFFLLRGKLKKFQYSNEVKMVVLILGYALINSFLNHNLGFSTSSALLSCQALHLFYGYLQVLNQILKTIIKSTKGYWKPWLKSIIGQQIWIVSCMKNKKWFLHFFL